MEISNPAAARACLQRIGYYRLSGYWYPFRTTRTVAGAPGSNPTILVEDNFRAGTHFRQVMDLYVFDKRLRMLLLDAIERIEVAFRVDLALLLGQRDKLAHRDQRQFEAFFLKPNGVGETPHGNWLTKVDEGFQRSKEEFVKHFKTKYPGDFPPIWIAIELWDFGTLSTLIGGLKYADRSTLATRYGLPRPDLLASFTRNLNNIRNICAHHARLWNRSPADRLSPPRPGEITLLDHIHGDVHAQSRIYATAAFLQYLLMTINPASSWGVRLRAHLKTLPVGNGINLRQTGFPHDWGKLDLWQRP
jgi:abortive infection bacteriophage resistance protein